MLSRGSSGILGGAKRSYGVCRLWWPDLAVGMAVRKTSLLRNNAPAVPLSLPLDSSSRGCRRTLDCGGMTLQSGWLSGRHRC